MKNQLVLTTIITIVISTFFYFLGTLNSPYYQLAYYFSEPSLVVYKAESASSIQVLDADGESVEGPVYATKLVMWNSGTETIPYEEVLKPLEISNSSAKRILDKSITNSIEKRGNFSLASPQSTSDSFFLQWEEFDPGAAVEVQLIVEGISNGIETETDELDIREAVFREFKLKGELVRENLVQGERGGRLLSLTLIAFGVLAFWSIVYQSFGVTQSLWKYSPPSSLGYVGKILGILSVVVCTLLLIAAPSLTVNGSTLMSLFRPSLYAPF